MHQQFRSSCGWDYARRLAHIDLTSILLSLSSKHQVQVDTHVRVQRNRGKRTCLSFQVNQGESAPR